MKELKWSDDSLEVVHAPIRDAAYPATPCYPPAEPPSGPPDGPGMIEVFRTLFRRWPVLLVSVLAGVAIAAVATALQVRVYQARALIEVHSFDKQVLSVASLEPAPFDPGENTYLQTQVQILKSQSLVERVIRKLGLDRRPDVVDPTPPLDHVFRKLGLPASRPLTMEKLTRRFLGNLTVRARPQSMLVEVLFEWTDPMVAASFVNCLTEQFAEMSLENRIKGAELTARWLTRQLDDVKRRLEKSQDELHQYAQTAGILFTGERENRESVTEQSLRHIQDELSKAQADRVARQAQYELAVNSPQETLAEVLDSPTLRDYQQKLAGLQGQLAEAAAMYTPSHYKYQRLQEQMNSMQAAADAYRGNIVHRVRNDYESAQRREVLLKAAYQATAKQVSWQTANAVHYDILRRDVETGRQLYDSLLRKVNDAGVTSAMKASNVSVIDPAGAPTSPFRPNPLLNGAAGLLSGLFVGVFIVLVREGAETRVRSPGELAACTNLPELGVVLSASRGWRHAMFGGGRDSTGRYLRLDQLGATLPDGAVALETWHRPSSPVSESVRASLTSILYTGKNGIRPRVIMLTSANDGDGKTAVSANLALALAELHQRVLVLDADLRKPQMHHVFGVSNAWGLSDLLKENRSVDEMPLAGLVRETAVPSLFVLPAGPGVASTMSLLVSARMQDLVSRFRKEFDMVIIDTPPVLQVPDARVLGRLADGAIVVVRAGVTSRDATSAAVGRLSDDGIRLLGTILNDWDSRRCGRSHYYPHAYYYHCQ